MKKLLITACCCMSWLAYGQAEYQSVQAQVPFYKNTLSFGMGKSKFFNMPFFIMRSFNDIQLSYTRHLNPKFSIQFSYDHWREYNKHIVRFYLPSYVGYLKDEYDSSNIGKRAYSSGFRYFDLSLNYSFTLARHHHLRIIGGPSLSNTWNEYIDRLKVSYWPDPMSGEVVPHVLDYEKRSVIENYWGAIGGIAYNYGLFKEHIYIGGEIRGRLYESYPFHISYTLNLSYNFDGKLPSFRGSKKQTE